MASETATPRPPLTGTPGPAPRQDAWRILGPGGGGTMLDPTLSPHDPRVVVEHCDMTGAYITHDGGESWRTFNLRTVVRAFAFDPGDPAVIYAGNPALWRSDDTGGTWQMVWPNPSANTVEHLRGDHADWRLTSDDPTYPEGGASLSAIAVDPADSRHVCFAAAAGAGAVLFHSEDGDATWSRLTELPQERILALYFPPATAAGPRSLYAVGRQGVYRGLKGPWERLGGPEDRPIHAASIGWRDGAVGPWVYALTPSAWESDRLAGGIYVSEDGGRTWRPAWAGLVAGVCQPGEGDPPRFRAVACQARDARVAYVSFQGLRLGDGPEGIYNGIARTDDGGRSWQIVHRESNRPSENLEGSWVEQRAPDSAPNIWFDVAGSLGVAPGDGDVCCATDLFRTYRTLDGGGTWEDVHSVRVGEDRWTTRGLDVTTCYGVHFDPFDLNHVFITYTDCGLFHSFDGGASWAGATVGIPNRWRNTAYWIELDPEVEGLVWGAFGFNHDLPRPKMWRHQDPAGYEGGVAVSTDCGRSWRVSNAGMPETACTHVLMDPASPPGARTLWACGFGRGVYKSIDNGNTWALKNHGIEGEQPFAWRITRADDGTLYLVVARRSDHGRIGDAEDGALYCSSDGGECWHKLALPEGTNGPTGLAVDPFDTRRLYLTAWGVARPEGDAGGGVFLSTDAGATWQSLFSESQHVYDLTLDPAEPRTLYVCGFDSGAWRSTDAGATWQRLKGYNFKWGHRVIVDPTDRSMVYITTFGGSVWYGPAAGDPGAVEDITTPPRRGR